MCSDLKAMSHHRCQAGPTQMSKDRKVRRPVTLLGFVAAGGACLVACSSQSSPRDHTSIVTRSSGSFALRDPDPPASDVVKLNSLLRRQGIPVLSATESRGLCLTVRSGAMEQAGQAVALRRILPLRAPATASRIAADAADLRYCR